MSITKTESDERGPCECCGDPGKKLGNRILCGECYEELFFGKIRNQNINFFGGTAATMEDDGSPGQQNAIRAMEG